MDGQLADEFDFSQPNFFGPTKVLVFPENTTYSVPSSTEAVEKRPVNDVFMIKDVTVHFPAGIEGLVDVRLTFGGNYVVPSKGDWVTGDDWGPRFEINNVVNEDGNFVAFWRNRDTENEHRVPIIVEYVEGTWEE